MLCAWRVTAHKPKTLGGGGGGGGGCWCGDWGGKH